MLRSAWLLLLTLALLPLTGCVSARVQAERDATATYNRCYTALRQANLPTYQLCQSKLAKARRQEQKLADAELPQANEQEWLKGQAEAAPWEVQILKSAVSEDLNTVTLETNNRSGVLDQQIEHVEKIVLVRENGRWVIDKDCCEYSNARFASP
ncbi:hypothetical protein D0B54_13415 [Solimonas sp. K1W22B-7]|uniref:hypothetical protein n=1 Tax=Solimonas sp. K1W22B-7 TaxID=2303331 RepID=UPI000E3340BD|nr:hypothetical protein [Solimonas sp. K1W22B-7]AXQ29626.1 hypothetical protein D0B54_13415 [Solimonas sp. K1W22B-7]